MSEPTKVRGPRFWVHDDSRMCRITLAKSTTEEAIADGFREVTAEEQDQFRAATRKEIAHGLK